MLTGPSHIFYQNPEIFDSQAQVDRLVDDLAVTMGVTRDGLNIVSYTSQLPDLHRSLIDQVATAKGMVSGPALIQLNDNTLLYASDGDSVCSYKSGWLRGLTNSHLGNPDSID